MKRILLSVMVISLFSFLTACGGKTKDSSSKANKPEVSKDTAFAQYIDAADAKGKTTMTLIGHASVKIVTKDGKVIYIDPFYDGDYSQPADLVIVTHSRDDHNKVDLVKLKDGGKTIGSPDYMKDGKYIKIEANGIQIEGTPAADKAHSVGNYAGVLLTIDGMTIYHASDTLNIAEMKNLTAKNIDYALLPVDGLLTMTMQDATDCANLINAKHAIPIHMEMNNDPYDKEYAKKFNAKNRMLVEYGKTIELVK